MNSPITFIAAITLLIGFLQSEEIQAHSQTAGSVTIAIPLEATGSSREASLRAMQAIATIVRKQHGLIDDTLLENKNQKNKPTHMHVTRWRNQKDWEALFSNPDFLKALYANSHYVIVSQSATIYIPMK